MGLRVDLTIIGTAILPHWRDRYTHTIHTNTTNTYTIANIHAQQCKEIAYKNHL